MRVGALGVFAFVVSAGTSAMAADLLRAPPVSPPAELRGSSFDWSGGYVGATAGFAQAVSTATEINTISDNGNLSYCAPVGTTGVPAGEYWCNVNGSAHYTSTPTSAYNLIGDTWSLKTHGMEASVLAGYNVQSGSLVYGVEGEVGYLSLKGHTGPSPASVDDTYLHTNATDFMSARLRVGYAFDRFLPYLTGGVAMGHFNNYVDDPDIAIGVTTAPTGTHAGFVIGAGAEYALTDHIILRGEWLHMGFMGQDTIGNVNVTCTTTICPPQWKLDRLGMAGDGTAGWRVKNTLDLLRAGVSYKF